jgi:hypothetical protein
MEEHPRGTGKSIRFVNRIEIRKTPLIDYEISVERLSQLNKFFRISSLFTFILVQVRLFRRQSAASGSQLIVNVNLCLVCSINPPQMSKSADLFTATTVALSDDRLGSFE